MFSMMTVLDEHKNMSKYDYLHFIEFCDMLCRIAIAEVNVKDTIEYKVYCLMDLLWQHCITTKMIDVNDYPLIPLEEEKNPVK